MTCLIVLTERKKKNNNDNNLSALKTRPIDLTWFAKIIACIAGGLFDIGR